METSKSNEIFFDKSLYKQKFFFFFLLLLFYFSKHENNAWSLLLVLHITAVQIFFFNPESLKLIKYSKKPQLSKHEALQCHFLRNWTRKEGMSEMQGKMTDSYKLWKSNVRTQKNNSLESIAHWKGGVFQVPSMYPFLSSTTCYQYTA